MKQILLILFILALAVPVSAQNELTSITNQLGKVDVSLNFITPGHILYDTRIAVEDLQEILTFDPTHRILLKQAHLNARIKELEQDAITKNNKNAAKILAKLQTKRMEIDADLEDLKPRCADVETGGITACKDFGTDSENLGKKSIYDAVKRQNYAVLGKLLESEKMPEQSKKGLTNAIEKSGLKSEIEEHNETITANMTQSYRSTAISYIPFRTAMVIIKGTEKKYAIVIRSNEITISDEMQLSNPDYYLYPTQSQTADLFKLAENVNLKKKLSWQDSIKLMSLWMEIQKKQGS